jgi:thiamine biosynthesis lipoprotein
MLALSVAIVTACGPSATTPRHLVERTYTTMGSPLRISAWTADDSATVAAFEQVLTEFDRLDNLLSVWKPDSDVVKINQAAGDHPVSVGPETIEVLRAARQVSEWTDGKFDVTFGALSDVWKFDHDQDNKIPGAEEIKARLPFIDFRKIVIDPAKQTVLLERRGMRMHLGGIGKGYAVDHGVQILRGAGINDFMIQAGGDFYVSGMKDRAPWRIGVRDPRGPADRVIAALDLSDGTFSTSGDYERFFMKDGRRYHHLLDPATGEPAQGCRSVTIVTNRATMADGLSTGVFILGAEKGMALIERLPDVEGLIVTSKNEVLVSSGLKSKLLMLAPPTDAP